MHQHSLDNSILCHIAQAHPEHPIASHHQHHLVHIVHAFVHPNCSNPACTAIAHNQPFRLELIGALAAVMKDPDASLYQTLRAGVPTGIFSAIPSSMQWPRKQEDLHCDAPDDVHLLHFSGNWTQAEENPTVIAQLLATELEQGWISKFPGSKADAQQHWPNRTAIGKLNVVFAEGKDPRLVLDSTVCNANTLCRIPEQVALPSSLDVHRSFLPSDLHGSWAGIALDVKAAHKRIKVCPAEQGALLFEWQGTLYYYTVCHFGAKFSAYWWQRLGALLSLLHGLLRTTPHRLWLYVDDLLILLQKARIKEDVALVVALLAALGVPISWRKAQLGAHITWCGWTFNFDCETVHLTREKLAKLRAQLQELRHSKKILRKKLESSLGLLMWATSTARHLRPYLSPLYKDLHSAKGTLKQIHHSQWQPFLDSLNSDATVSRQPIGVWLPLHARIVAVGSTDVQSKADIPRVPPAHKAQWIRITDPHRTEIHLRDESRDAIDWLESCFSHDRVRSLLQCYAAADAMAQGNLVGIGGWIVTSNTVAWFSEQYNMSEIRSLWPALQDTAQRYIACFETLAQLALAMLAHSTCSARLWSFTLPAASDNAPTEAGLDKLWSTAEPLGTFLKLAAAWAAKHHVDFQVTHLAGEKNTWADALSRNQPSVFRHRTAQQRRFPLSTFLDALGCVTLHPPGAAWSDELRAAQHPRASEEKMVALHALHAASQPSR